MTLSISFSMFLQYQINDKLVFLSDHHLDLLNQCVLKDLMHNSIGQPCYLLFTQRWELLKHLNIDVQAAFGSTWVACVACKGGGLTHQNHWGLLNPKKYMDFTRKKKLSCLIISPALGLNIEKWPVQFDEHENIMSQLNGEAFVNNFRQVRRNRASNLGDDSQPVRRGHILACQIKFHEISSTSKYI